jgi:hypothetical protein
VDALHALLSHALLDLTRAAERGGADQVVLWSNLLRAVDDGGVDRKQLPALVRLSKRAVKSTADGLVRRGWATVDEERLWLSDEARDARERWREAMLAAESSWIGAATVRAPLEALVSTRPLEHPHYCCGYGGSDWRISGGPGVDWKPVHRNLKADTVSGLPTLALLSQALVAFAFEYESRVPFALRVGLYLHQAFGDGPVALADAPRALRISGDGRSSLERHGAVTVTDGIARLTDVGEQVRAAYPSTVDAIEAEWATEDLRAVLEELDVHEAGHADHPDVAWIGRGIGFAEVSSQAR